MFAYPFAADDDLDDLDYEDEQVDLESDIGDTGVDDDDDEDDDDLSGSGDAEPVISTALEFGADRSGDYLELSRKW